MKSDPELIQVARGNRPADIILSNAKIVNVFTGEIKQGNIAIYHGRIAGTGDYHQADRIIDLHRNYALPGLLDGHVHLESSMLDVGQYARAVVPHGTLGIITDLHEIANVCGIAGIEYILNSAKALPLDLFLMAPSCVPATNMETAGAEIGPSDVRRLLRLKKCIGLGEVMNYPGVLFSDAALLDKIRSAGRKIVDGHAPGLSGKDLNAYIAAGIRSDHESVTSEEAAAKLRNGMHVMVREGSSEKNLEALLPLVTDINWKQFLFVVDDRTCADLLNDGDMDAILRKAIRLGLDPVRAIQMATINTAEYFRLDGLGAIAPGYYANIVIASNLADFRADMVFYKGQLVAQNGRPLFQLNSKLEARNLRMITNTINFKQLSKESLELRVSGDTEPVIGIVPGQIITRKLAEKMGPINGVIVPDLSRDILKLVVVERHKATGNIGIGLVKGIGLQQGAIASSIAHDSHNIVACGTNDDDIITAIEAIGKQRGGLVIASGGKLLGGLALPVAGLLSHESAEQVAASLGTLEKIAKGLGCVLASPFATLSFLALPVIPELRLTDLGLVDVTEFKLLKRG